MGETNKLFAVYLGGRAPGANIELHDVVFIVGPTIEGSGAKSTLEVLF